MRDPREFVDEKKIGKFLDELRKFSKEAAASGNVDKYAKKL